MKTPASLCFALCTLLVPPPALAACLVEAKTISSLLSLPLEYLMEIEVAVASKTPEQVFDAPSSVTVFTRRELQSMGVESLEELLNFVPGFMASRESVFGDGNMVAARGRTTPQASYNILFMLNGQRLNNDHSGGALTVNRFIPLHHVKQVEIIRGPGSALYGTSAFSGVVNVITADDLNEAYLGAGNLDSREAYVNVSDSGADWRVALSARYQEDKGEDYASRGFAGVSDPRQARDVLVNAQRGCAQAMFSHSQRRQEGFLIGDQPGRNATFAHNFLNLRYDLLDQADRALAVYGGYSWQDSEISAEVLSAGEIAALPAGFSDADAPLLNGTLTEEREWSLGLEGRYRLNTQHELFAGLEWRQPDNTQDRQLLNYTSPDMAALYDGMVRVPIHYAGDLIDIGRLSKEGAHDIFSVYLQDKYRINESWSATLGARYDHYSDNGASTTPRASLHYTLTPSTAFKLLYGEAFRAPSVRQLSGVLVGNPDLQAETVKTLELAWLQKYHKAQTTLTWYSSRHANLIDTRPRPNGPGRQFQNLPGSVETAGWELEASAQPTDNLSLRGAYSYAYQTEEDSRRFPHQTFSVMVNYRLEQWNFNLSAYHHGSVEQPLGLCNAPLEGYWVGSAVIRYTLSKQLTLTGRFHNLLDEDYAGSVKTVTFAEGLPERGRTYSLGVEFSF
jgi:outer membrane receptor protein involved in Fe transport